MSDRLKVKWRGDGGDLPEADFTGEVVGYVSGKLGARAIIVAKLPEKTAIVDVDIWELEVVE